MKRDDPYPPDRQIVTTTVVGLIELETDKSKTKALAPAVI